MSSCRQCGANADESDTYCGRCGTRLRELSADLRAYRSQAGVLNYSVPEIASFYRRLATKSAYALPEEVTLLLLTVWVADTRGESFELGQELADLVKQWQSFLIWTIETRGGAAREGHSEPEDDDVVGDMAWLLYRDPSLNLRGAIECNCEYFRCGSPHVAGPDEINAARTWLRKEVQRWLTRNNIKFYEGPLTFIPSTALQRALAQFAGKPDIHLAPNIPQDKLANAREECGVPDKETIGLLIDCTFFGFCQGLRPVWESGHLLSQLRI